MSSNLRIVVTGLAATYPFGGVFWDYIQYLLGFQRLGHDVLYIEDTGKWCYDPIAETFIEGGEKNAKYLEKHINRLAPHLSDRWFFRDSKDRTYGQPWNWVVEFCRSADLFLHISASCLMRDEYLEAQITGFIDSDPMYTQVAFLENDPDMKKKKIEWWKQNHQVFFTFGENIGQPDCLVPTGSIEWIPTRQPVILDCFSDEIISPDSRRNVITTVSSWKPSKNELIYNGVTYADKSIEFLRFLELPSKCILPIETALSGPAPYEQLKAAGWQIVDVYPVSRDPWVYREYLANSWAEFSVAKNAYVATQSGWFSCRSACYLALGVPVVVQDTGFSKFIPTGKGLFAFSNLEEAAESIKAIKKDYKWHQKGAIEIAVEFFDAKRVLSEVLKKSGFS